MIFALLASQVLDRGEKIELLVDKTENLQFQVYVVPCLVVKMR